MSIKIEQMTGRPKIDESFLGWLVKQVDDNYIQ